MRLDLVGTVLSALGLALIVFGILRAGTWGFVKAKPGAPELARAVADDLADARRRGRHLAVPAVGEPAARSRPRAARRPGDPARTRCYARGLTSFFFQYFLQGGLFFAVPLFLSVALGLSAIQTGVRLLPLSITLLVAAAGVPKFFPHASPRRVVRIGFLTLFAGIWR